MFKSLLLIGLLAGNVAAAPKDAAAGNVTAESEAFNLEVMVEGRRQLFPLLPGTKCPAGHRCHARHTRAGVAPMMSSLKDNLKNPLMEQESWHSLNTDLKTVVESGDYCTRRSAMARAAGLIGGLSFAMANGPAYAAETKMVNMGSDSGGLQFVPDKVKICKGDSVTWVLNRAGPHNVVFDEDAVPSGVNAEAMSMEGYLNDEGDEYTKKFDVAGSYDYFCAPHRSAGMNGKLTVE